MSWDDDDERRKAFRRWLGDFLPESIFKDIEEIMERMMSEMDGNLFDPDILREMMSDPRSTKPFVFGFRMRVGPDGKPVIERFGDPTPKEIHGELPPPIEPLVDVFEEDDEIIVVADLPGVEKDEIRVRVKGQTLTIHVDNPERPYHKEIKLPAKVVRDNATSSLRNGVLEVRLQKASK